MVGSIGLKCKESGSAASVEVVFSAAPLQAVALRSRLDKLCAGKVVSEVGQADGGWRQGGPESSVNKQYVYIYICIYIYIYVYQFRDVQRYSITLNTSCRQPRRRGCSAPHGGADGISEACGLFPVPQCWQLVVNTVGPQPALVSH